MAVAASRRWTYAIAAWATLAMVVGQFLLAGLGVFAPELGGFVPHGLYGAVAVALAMLLLIVCSYTARRPRRTVSLAWLLFGLLILQSLLINVFYRTGVPGLRPFAALHVLNGLLIFWLALRVASEATGLVTRREAA